MRAEAKSRIAAALAALLGAWRSPFLLRPDPGLEVDPHPRALQRMLAVARASEALLTYGDYLDALPQGLRPHPLADAQLGSLQETFDFGPLALWSREAVDAALAQAGPLPTDLQHHAWYDLRLRGSLHRPLVRIPEPLALARAPSTETSGHKVFSYLLASRQAQVEAEAVATRHLERLGALLRPPFRAFQSHGEFPVEASVVIPVRDRRRTIADAVRSALSQQADFPFNVLVVDNHSSDGTSELLADQARAHERLVHIQPTRQDLGIGGCWNEAIFHPACGRWAVQLDSDDLYSGPDTLATMVRTLRQGACGMAVGAYSTVDMQLQPISPGLVDHREWSDHNGPNNALRVGGLGAPRAFATELLRASPFPNASYGEDYAVALRISRQYRVGRVYRSLYLCRRWEENSDADLPPQVAARYQHYKDRLRTLEIQARRRLVRGAP